MSLLHPVAEDSSHWHPRSAGEGTRQVLDALGEITRTLSGDSRLFPFDSSRVRRLWQRTLKWASVRFSRPHTLRHSFASILLSRRAPVLYLVKVGGWKDATTPLRVYAKWADQEPDSATPVQPTETGMAGQTGKVLELRPVWSEGADQRSLVRKLSLRFLAQQASLCSPQPGRSLP